MHAYVHSFIHSHTHTNTHTHTHAHTHTGGGAKLAGAEKARGDGEVAVEMPYAWAQDRLECVITVCVPGPLRAHDVSVRIDRQRLGLRCLSVFLSICLCIRECKYRDMY